MRSHLHVLTALAFSACSTHEWTTVRVNESLDVREVSPRSLPSSPADAPSATRITLIAADGKTFAVKPGTVYLQEPNFVLFRRYAGTEEVRMMAEDVWAIHFEEFKSG